MLEGKGVALTESMSGTDVSAKLKEVMLQEMITAEVERMKAEQELLPPGPLETQASIEEGEVVPESEIQQTPQAIESPPAPPSNESDTIIAKPPRTSGANDVPITLHLIPLSDLLDYTPQDRMERHFEVSVAAEMLICYLSRYFASTILNAFVKQCLYPLPEPTTPPAPGPVVEDNTQSGDGADPMITEGNTQDGGAEADTPAVSAQDLNEQKALEKTPSSPAPVIDSFRPYELLQPSKFTPLLDYFISLEGQDQTDESRLVGLFLALRFLDRHGHGSLSKTVFEKLILVGMRMVTDDGVDMHEDD